MHSHVGSLFFSKEKTWLKILSHDSENSAKIIGPPPTEKYTFWHYFTHHLRVFRNCPKLQVKSYSKNNFVEVSCFSKLTLKTNNFNL